MGELILNAQSAPSTPSSNKMSLYLDGDAVRAPAPIPSLIDEFGHVYRVGDKRCALAADMAVTTSTTLADVTGCGLTVKNGQFYRFHFTVVWRTATATTGLKVGLTTPTFTTFSAVARGVVAAGATAAQWTDAITSSGDSASLSGGEATTTDYIAEVEGIIVPSADGTVQLQRAAEVGAAGNVTVKAGTCGQLWVF